jgi:SET domain-containing protein
MKNPIRVPIKLKNSPIHGYGVFAATRIRKNQTIEECPIILSREYYPEIQNFAFDWIGEKYALALG